jgi:16S rRNA (adenine1518-N6/adenine1519-N6)-dimethyltransferase
MLLQHRKNLNMARFGAAKKHFGQNFLQDETVIAAILSAFAAQKGERVLEIGPGLGALTQHLLTSGAVVDVVEIDNDLIGHLQRCYPQLKQIHHQDALTFSLMDLNLSQQKVRIIGNLPYNISTPLLFHLLIQKDHINDMLFMLQQEVVDRLAAQPGCKAYGRLSVMMQLQCKVQALFSVPPQAFKPQPKVMSKIVYLVPYEKPLYDITSMVVLEDILRDAFNQRRKTIHNSLKQYFNSEQLIALGLDPKMRAEQISVEQWVKLANSVSRS